MQNCITVQWTREQGKGEKYTRYFTNTGEKIFGDGGEAGSGANSEFPIGYSVIWGAGYWDE